jgi:hypothetical protein
MPPCRLLASVVKNFCRSVVLDVLEEPSDDPSAVKRFWKSVDSVLSLDEVPVVLASVDVLSESEVEVELDAELDVSACARLSIADAKPPP